MGEFLLMMGDPQSEVGEVLRPFSRDRMMFSGGDEMLLTEGELLFSSISQKLLSVFSAVERLFSVY
jgi:hypothetical protein